jgi:macrolide transport system ATP-binding/permease protein
MFSNLMRAVARIRAFLKPRALDRELDQELESHLAMMIDDNIGRGMSPDEARRAAMIRLGKTQSIIELHREARALPAVDTILQDIRYTFRSLRRDAGFTVFTILMLALGLCASVAIFAFVDASLIKPLPYRDPSRLVGVFESVQMFPRSNLSYFDYLDWKSRNRVFSSLDVYNRTEFIWTSPAGAQPVRGTRVSSGFFRTLGVSPALGRDFYEGEDLPEAPRTAILSYDAWQSRFGGRDDILGQTVILDGAPVTIVGMLPREFHFAPAEPAEFWTTLTGTTGCEKRRGCHNLYGVARLKDGVSLDTALADVKSIAAQLEKEYPDSNRDQGAAVALLSEVIVGDIRPILLVLLSGAGLLLLIAGVNVASLLLVRTESRKREIAVRCALGASPARLVRQFVTEGLVLVTAASLLGLASAYWGIQILTALIPTQMFASMSYLHGLGLNGRVLLFAGVVSLLAAAMFSLTPTLRLSFSEMRDGLAESSRGSAGTVWRRLGSRFVVIELATAVVLLVGAGLLGKSLHRLLNVEIGLEPDHLVTLGVAAPASSYSTSEQEVALCKEIVRRASGLAGVKSVGVASNGLPVGSNGNTNWFRVLGRPWHGEHNEAPERDVSPEYFATLGAKLVRGRYFDEHDDASKPRVAIINQTLAKQYFPDEDPIGKQLSYLSEPPVPIEIVGIIEDIKEGPLDTPTPSAMYLPFYQSSDNYLGIVVRTSQSEGAVLQALAATIREIDPGMVTTATMTMNDRINDSPSAYLHRSSAWLVGGFATIALLLSVVGLYGVIAYSVSQRRREIGIRLALGAQRSSVYGMVLKEAGWLASSGIVAGLLISIPATTVVKSLLFGVGRWDLPILVSVAAMLAASTLIASYVPARRAASVNPVEALRSE